MNDPTTRQLPKHRSLSDSGLAWLTLALALLCLMPTNQSLWIDEAFTVPYATQKDLAGFADEMLHQRGSEPKMPLGMLSFWVGEKVLGASEIGLRLVSTAWIAVALLLLWDVGRVVRIPWLPILAACHPFVWYYGSEARPYAMCIAAGAGLALAIAIVIVDPEKSDRGVACFLVFGPLLCGATIIGVAPTVAVGAVLSAILIHRRWRPDRRMVVMIVLSGIVTLALTGYYATNVARGSTVIHPQSWTLSISSLVVSAYEFLGMSGFGPGRDVLRELGLNGNAVDLLRTLARPRSIGLLILGASSGVLLFRSAVAARSSLSEHRRLVTGISVILLLGIVFVYALSMARSFTFWGRHIAALLPFLLLVLAMAAATHRSNSARTPGPLAAVLLVTLLASSLLIRFHPEHRRDDYRSAAAFARAAVAEHRTVWWAAAHNAGLYYGVPFCDDGRFDQPSCVHLIHDDESADLAARPHPDLVLVSKPDLFDRTHALRDFINANGFRPINTFQAFTVLSQSAMAAAPDASSGDFSDYDQVATEPALTGVPSLPFGS